MSDIKQIPHHSFFSEPPVLQVKYSVGYTSIHICEIVNKFSINFVPGHLMRALSIACVKTSTFLNQSRHTRTMLACSLLTQRCICVYLKQQHKEILLSGTLISFFFLYFKSINLCNNHITYKEMAMEHYYVRVIQRADLTKLIMKYKHFFCDQS